MSTKTWYPTSDISLGIQHATGAGTHYTEVDDPDGVPDDGATRIYSGIGETTYALDMFGHTNDPVPNGATGISMTLYAATASLEPEAATTTFYFEVHSGAGTYQSAALITADTAYIEQNAVCANNPDGNVAWSATTINAATFGIALRAGADGNKNNKCDYLHAIVTYTDPVTLAPHGCIC